MKRCARRHRCEDATAASQAQGGLAYRFAYVDQDGFERHPPDSLAGLMTMFREYQPLPETSLTGIG